MSHQLLRGLRRLSLGVRHYHGGCQTHSLSSNKALGLPPLPSLWNVSSVNNDGSQYDKGSPIYLDALDLAGIAQKEILLPGSIPSSKNQLVILDPSPLCVELKLPTVLTPISEKVQPSLVDIVPITEPTLPGTVEKLAMPWPIRIRRKMHKRNKLHKRKARMVFITRRINRLKLERKETKIRAIEEKWAQRGKDFDAEIIVAKKRVLAREGGYRVDVLREYKESLVPPS